MNSRPHQLIRIVALTFLATLAVWLVLSRPLPRYAASGIPCSARNASPETARYMIPGDHLQFLYHMWLAADMVKGETPLFRNLYEFNTGSDAERYAPGSYYVPFSLVFTALSLVCSTALAWNLTGLVSLWGTLLVTWLLVRRHVPDPWICGASALVSILFPYRWITLFGGSPTGLAMMLVPCVYLGTEMMLVDRRPAGALLAGFALLFAIWVDAHVFLFSCLSAPCWAIAVYALRGKPGSRRKESGLQW